MAQARQPRLPAQRQHLAEEVLEHRPEPLPELRDGVEVGLQPASEVHEGDMVAAGLGQLARGVDAPAGAVEQQADHRLRVEGGPAPLSSVGLMDGSQVELLHDLTDNVHRVVGGDEVGQRWRQQEGLVWCVGMIRSHGQMITRPRLRLNRQAPSGGYLSGQHPGAGQRRSRWPWAEPAVG